MPECRKNRIRKWDDVYETIREDLRDGILAGGGKAAKPADAYSKKDVDAMFADVGNVVKGLLDTVARLEKKLAKGKGE